MKRKALIVGSAPISEGLKEADLTGYERIAINKSWQLRPDFQYHIYLESLNRPERPPKDYAAISVDRKEYSPLLSKAGGPYLCSNSVAMIAGYWAIAQRPVMCVSYYGCDLVFAKAGDTHFYGTGDEGPLLGVFSFNDRQDLKSLRLFAWGLLHRVFVTNSSAEEGSKLCFPTIPLHQEQRSQYDTLFHLPETFAVIAAAQEAFLAEIKLRTPMFNRRLRLFLDDADAQAALTQIHAAWEPVADLVTDLRRVLTSEFGFPA